MYLFYALLGEETNDVFDGWPTVYGASNDFSFRGCSVKIPTWQEIFSVMSEMDIQPNNGNESRTYTSLKFWPLSIEMLPKGIQSIQQETG